MERESQDGIGAGGSRLNRGNSGGFGEELGEESMAGNRARLRERRRARLDTVKVKTFTGEGWHLWKFKMQQYLALMDVWRNVNGEAPPPPEDAPSEDQMDWLQDDLSAMNVLCNTVDDERLQLLTHCNSSAEMWKVLVDKYEVVSTANKIRLDVEFNNLRQGSKSVDAYLKELNATVDKLRGIGKIVPDEEKMLAFLKGLNREFGVLSVMLENQTGMTFDQATASVLTHEMRYNSASGGTLEEPGEAYPAGFRGRGRGKGGRSRGGRGGGSGRGTPGRGSGTPGRGSGKAPTFTCYTCGQVGHISRLCPDAQKNGVACLQCGKRGHISYNCPTNPRDNGGEHYSAEGVIGEANLANKMSTWIVDSGATHHVCNEEKAFSVLRGNPSAAGVIVGNNTRLDVPKEGEVKLDFSVGQEVISGIVNGVLYVPDMARNLFSVTQTMKQGKSVLFDSKSMSCKILKDGKEVGAAHLKGGLWILDCDQSMVGEANVAASNNTMELWHQRLGHLGEDNVKKLQVKQMVSGLDATLDGHVKGSCEGCKEGRQHREPFPESEKIKRKKLELVQSDIKGPITPVCHGGFRFFLTFLDVGSRRTWVYLIKNKNKAFPIFKWWKAQVEREAECKVKALRTDQGGEYSSKEFQAYLRDCGIRHEFTVARTPQQNGRAERLNRTLMDTARSMTNGANLPKEFWGEAVLTAAYIKNRSPHAALEENATPEEA
jgi:gag-polypeptide of LTR copia-type/Integrase core domain/GAG-pre-integrase domain/Zinc knuckle